MTKHRRQKTNKPKTKLKTQTIQNNTKRKQKMQKTRHE